MYSQLCLFFFFFFSFFPHLGLQYCFKAKWGFFFVQIREKENDEDWGWWKYGEWSMWEWFGYWESRRCWRGRWWWETQKNWYSICSSHLFPFISAYSSFTPWCLDLRASVFKFYLSFSRKEIMNAIVPYIGNFGFKNKNSEWVYIFNHFPKFY